MIKYPLLLHGCECIRICVANKGCQQRAASRYVIESLYNTSSSSRSLSLLSPSGKDMPLIAFYRDHVVRSHPLLSCPLLRTAGVYRVTLLTL